MTALPLTLRRPPEELLPVVATVALAAFYYLTRADVVGVFTDGRGWHALTGRPLAAGTHFALAALLLGVGPALVARRLTGRPFVELGLGWGRPRLGLAWLAAGIPVAVLAGWIGSRSPEMRAVYPLDPEVLPTLRSFGPHALRAFLYFGSWEVLFRGVLLFGLAGRIGPGAANVVQTALSVTAHFGRPLDEAWAALPAGLGFGAVSHRVGSIWYVAVIHWVVGLSVDWFILNG